MLVKFRWKTQYIKFCKIKINVQNNFNWDINLHFYFINDTIQETKIDLLEDFFLNFDKILSYSEFKIGNLKTLRHAM